MRAAGLIGRGVFGVFAILGAACGLGLPELSLRDEELGCVPQQTVRCLCGLDEGTQTCSADRKLSACSCLATRAVATDGAAPIGTAITTPHPPTPEPKPSLCGNGTLDQGESCDDGNTASNDGCSSTCKPDGNPPSGETCPGQSVVLWPGLPVVLAGTTSGYKHDHAAFCDEWAMSPDRVYEVKPTADGVMTVAATFSADFKAVVSIRKEACTHVIGEPLCEVTRGNAFQRVIEVKKDVPVYILIDGEGENTTGPFAITIEMP